jgi:glycosyltransferase involved in cell wall biosynthesis
MIKKARKLKLYIYHFIHEFIRYDHPTLKLPLSLALIVTFKIQYLNKQYLNSIQTLTLLFRSGWLGSRSYPTKTLKKILNTNLSKGMFKFKFKSQLINSVIPQKNTEKFFLNQTRLFKVILIVVKSKNRNEKGIIIIKYSYYFSLFIKLFDVEKIAENYHIVLEPSWAGFSDPNILIYTLLKTPVYVMTYEERDRLFLERINTNLIPVGIGPSWWVDQSIFNNDLYVKKDIDIVIIASWAKFKRHYYLFKTFAKLKRSGHKLKIAMAGYPGDYKLNDIKELAEIFELNDQIQYFEWLPPVEVSELLQRSKINILWSRFEGNNRSIIEGMFCNTPCIIREGHNFGDKYPYINKQTGMEANENNLAETILSMLSNYDEFSPRDYVTKKHNNIIATKILKDTIEKTEYVNKKPFSGKTSLKVNNLHGMEYAKKDDISNYKEDYAFLKDCIL